MRLSKINRLARIVLLTLTAVAGAASAQQFPSKPITLIVPYPPGGAGDVAARKMADSLTRQVGQPVVILNQGARDGVIGAGIVARATPDGYTLLAADPAPITLSSLLRTNLPFDPMKDLTPVAEYLYVPLILVAQPGAPFKSIKEFIDQAKANPGKYKIGTGSTLLQLGTELIRQKAGVDILSVPYKGGAASVQDLLGGSIDAVVTSTGPVAGLVNGGKLRILASFGRTRGNNALAEVPTMVETGYPDAVVGAWFGILGPKGLPANLSTYLSQKIAEAAKTDEMKALANQFGGEIAVYQRGDFARRLAAERANAAPVVKAAKMVAGE